MSNHRKNGGLDTETKTMLGLIAVFFLGAVGSYIFGSPILTAVCAGLIVTALLYRFFGGGSKEAPSQSRRSRRAGVSPCLHL